MKKATDRSAKSPCGPESIRPAHCRAGAALARKAYCPVAQDGRAHGEADVIDEVFLIRFH
jgi:hypothetical protein